jgi:hypothetical protein
VKDVPIIAPPARKQFYTNRRSSSGAGKRWFVYAKPPFGGPAHILRYLGRYTHRTFIHTSPRSRATDLQMALNDTRDHAAVFASIFSSTGDRTEAANPAAKSAPEPRNQTIECSARSPPANGNR